MICIHSEPSLCLCSILCSKTNSHKSLCLITSIVPGITSQLNCLLTEQVFNTFPFQVKRGETQWQPYSRDSPMTLSVGSEQTCTSISHFALCLSQRVSAGDLWYCSEKFPWWFTLSTLISNKKIDNVNILKHRY